MYSFQFWSPSGCLLELSVDGSEEVPDRDEPFAFDVVEFSGVFEDWFLNSCNYLHPIQVDLDCLAQG